MIYRFATCTLDTDTHRFMRAGKPVHVEPQVFDLLRMLADSNGRLVTKDDLVETVWRGMSVSDSTISARINAARTAVGDTGAAQAIIKTVHGRGFQLIAEVGTDAAASAPQVATNPAERQSIRFVPSTKGARIATAQSGSGPPLVRVGHWLSHLELDWHSPVWLPLLQALGQDNTLIRYDQRGTGLSSRDLAGADLETFVDDLERVADAHGLDRFPVFAASQAVPVAIRFAVRCPERVSGLVLYGGYAQGRALRDLAPDDIKEDTVLGLIRAGWGKADSAFMNAFSTLFMPDATPAQMDDFVKMQLVTIAPENAAELRQIVDRFDVRAQLPLLRAPTLVVHALGDAIQPIEQGRILASEIPDARFLPLDSRNHIPLPQQGSWAHMMQETGQFLENMCRAR